MWDFVFSFFPQPKRSRKNTHRDAQLTHTHTHTVFSDGAIRERMTVQVWG